MLLAEVLDEVLRQVGHVHLMQGGGGIAPDLLRALGAQPSDDVFQVAHQEASALGLEVLGDLAGLPSRLRPGLLDGEADQCVRFLKLLCERGRGAVRDDNSEGP